MSSKVTELQREITDLQQKHQMELLELQGKLKKSHDHSLVQKDVMQKQEISALTQEWNKERQVNCLFTCIFYFNQVPIKIHFHFFKIQYCYYY